MSAREIVIDAGYDFEKIAYVPVQFHRRTAFSKITCANMELCWPGAAENELLAQWFAKEEIYRAFGFSKPPAQSQIARAALPDLSAKERCVEAVEFLMVRDSRAKKAIGFFVIFEARCRADPNQEIDFAVLDEDYRGRLDLLRKIELGICGYLFGVRGARSIFWVRRKPAPVAPNEALRYRQTGKPFLITRRQFKRRLQRRKRRGDDEAFPIRLLMKS